MGGLILLTVVPEGVAVFRHVSVARKLDEDKLLRSGELIRGVEGRVHFLQFDVPVSYIERTRNGQGNRKLN